MRKEYCLAAGTFCLVHSVLLPSTSNTIAFSSSCSCAIGIFLFFLHSCKSVFTCPPAPTLLPFLPGQGTVLLSSCVHREEEVLPSGFLTKWNGVFFLPMPRFLPRNHLTQMAFSARSFRRYMCFLFFVVAVWLLSKLILLRPCRYIENPRRDQEFIYILTARFLETI